MSTQTKAVNLDSGLAMVITDLHGEGPVFDRLRDRFLALHSAGQVDRLIIVGDLIHHYGHESEDHSLRMLLEVMRLQHELGDDRVIMLLGNHEVPHIYSLPLSKGNMEFTARFEQALNRINQDPASAYRRTDVTRFLRSLPFYVRTKAGVMIAHTGAAQSVDSLQAADELLNFDHDILLQIGDSLLQMNYPVEALRHSEQYLFNTRRFLAIPDANDPRFTNLLRGQIISEARPEYALLWDALFNRNELEMGFEAYREAVKRFLRYMSDLSPYPQRVLLTGHIPVRGGYTEVGSQQFRLATYTHATPLDAGCYLILDCAKPVNISNELGACVQLTREA